MLAPIAGRGSHGVAPALRGGAAGVLFALLLLPPGPRWARARPGPDGVDSLLDDTSEAIAATHAEDAAEWLAEHRDQPRGRPRGTGSHPTRFRLVAGPFARTGIRGVCTWDGFRGVIRLDRDHGVAGLSWAGSGGMVAVGGLRFRVGNRLFLGRGGYDTVPIYPAVSGPPVTVRVSRAVRGVRRGAFAMRTQGAWHFGAGGWRGVDQGIIGLCGWSGRRHAAAFVGGRVSGAAWGTRVPFASAYVRSRASSAVSSLEIARVPDAWIGSVGLAAGSGARIRVAVERAFESDADGVLRVRSSRLLSRVFARAGVAVGGLRGHVEGAQVLFPLRAEPVELKRLTVGGTWRTGCARILGDVRWSRRIVARSAGSFARSGSPDAHSAVRLRLRLDTRRRESVWQRVDVRVFADEGTRGSGISLWWLTGWAGRHIDARLLAGRFVLRRGQLDYAGRPAITGVFPLIVAGGRGSAVDARLVIRARRVSCTFWVGWRSDRETRTRVTLGFRAPDPL